MSKANYSFPGTSWVGSLYRRIESICNEVDEVVTQQTVRYVEDHVMSVGENVKKFCSNTVQDLLHVPWKSPSEHDEPEPPRQDSIVSNDDEEECPSAIGAGQSLCTSPLYPNSDTSEDEYEECPAAVDDEQSPCEKDAVDVADGDPSCKPCHLDEELSTMDLDEVRMIYTAVSLGQEVGSLIDDNREQSIEVNESSSVEVLESKFHGEEPCEASASSDGSTEQEASDHRCNTPELERLHKTVSNHVSSALSISPASQHVTSVASSEGNILDIEMSSSVSSLSVKVPRDPEISPPRLVAEEEKFDDLLPCRGDAANAGDDYLSRKPYLRDCHIVEELGILYLDQVKTISTGVSLCQEDGTLISENSEQSTILKKESTNQVLGSECLGKELCEAPSSPAAQHITTREGNILDVEMASSMSLVSIEIPMDSEISPAKLSTVGGKFDELDDFEEHISLTRQGKTSDRDADYGLDDSSTSLATHPVACGVSCGGNIADVKLVTSTNSISVEPSRMSEILPMHFVAKGEECWEHDHFNKHKSPPRQEKMCNQDSALNHDDSGSLSCSRGEIYVPSCDSRSTDVGSTSSFNPVLPELSSNHEYPQVDLPQKGGEECSVVAYLKNSYTYSLISLDRSDSSSSHFSPTQLSGKMDYLGVRPEEDPKMQTLELRKKIRFRRLGLHGAHNVNRALRRKARDLGFYKKMLQHALTSRKRTEKEYMQLAIWYGDIEADLNLFSEQNHQSIAIIPILNDTATENTQDSEWELV